MPLDLSKLTDAVTKVASLAKSHADVTSAVASVTAARDAAVADLVQAQKDVDALTAQLVAAATSPAEAVGLAAVAQAVAAPALPVDPSAPAAPLVTQVPADAPAVVHPATVDELNAAIARVNAQAAS